MSVSGIRHYAYFEKNLYFEIRISHKDVVRAGRKECRVMYGQASDKRVRISHGITEKMRRRRARRRRRLLKRIGFVAANLFLVCLLFVVVRNGLVAKDLSQSAGVTKMQTKPQSFAVEPIEPEPESEEALPSEPEEDGVYRIVLDPGHGGEDEGCSRDGVCESTINLAIALYTADFLREEGFEVILTREDETNVSLKKRVEMAEDVKADIFVSIHQNACEEQAETVNGIETWYYESSENSRRLATLIHQSAVKKTKAVERTLQKGSGLYVIRATSMPACLIETGFLSNAQERENLIDADYQKKLAAGIAEGIKYYFFPKTMYLTFDDGPSAENTNAVLDILREKGVKATFFVVGENVKKHPEVAKRIVEEGHSIGIHCNRHDYDTLYASVDSYLEDLEAANQAVLEATGVETKLLRFPGGSVNSYNREICEELTKRVTEEGYVYFDWNGSLEDAVKKSEPDQLILNAKATALDRKKVVMLAHDIVYNTTQCLPDLLESFPEYRFEALSEEVKPICF